MKKLFFLSVAVFIYGVFSVNAQNIDTVKNIKRCSFDEYLKQQKILDPTFELRMQALEVATQEWIKNNQDYLENSKTVITIPTVVHIISNTADMSDARVQEQIDVTNRDYAGLNPHSMEAFSSNLKANTGIQFCLAKRDPQGKATTGIERRKGINHTFGDNDKMKHYSTDGLDQWDPKRYMNIWVCNLSGGIVGIGRPPVAPLNSNFGVVIGYGVFGITGVDPPLNGGSTLTHEIGHCFYLYHIWGANGNCSTDYCADTPPQAAFTEGSPTGVKTDACSTSSPGIMYMNFLDYTDDIKMANFTPNQSDRIQAQFGAGQALESLKTSNGCMVGIEENNFIQNINIFPNPTNGELNIKFNIANPCNVNVSIHNILGEEIYSFNKNKTSVVNTNVDISNNASGIYFVKIKTEKQILTQKISLLK